MLHTSLTDPVPAICTSLAKPGFKNSKERSTLGVREALSC